MKTGIDKLLAENAAAIDQSQTRPKRKYIWCVQCGPEVAVDADGCCKTCGIDALGPFADIAMHSVIAIPDLCARLRLMNALVEQAIRTLKRMAHQVGGACAKSDCAACEAFRTLVDLQRTADLERAREKVGP